MRPFDQGGSDQHDVRQDYISPLQTSQRPLFQALGTPSAAKKHVLCPGGHEIFATQRSQIVHEVVGWLDRYVGRVQQRAHALIFSKL